MLLKWYKAIVLAIITFTLVGCAQQTESTESTDNRPKYNTELLVTQSAGLTESEAMTVDLSQYLQNPELPTGCEACAAAALLYLNGIEVTKFDVANKMPKSEDGSDFVNKFWGSPYSSDGMMIMEPGIVDTIKTFLPLKKTVFTVKSTLTYLPTPCQIWVTVDLEEPRRSEWSQLGYTALLNTHSVVLLYVDEASAIVFDPLIGTIQYPFSKLDQSFMGNGSQAVYIAPRGYRPSGEE